MIDAVLRVLLAPMIFCMAHPFAALIPAAVFAVLAVRSRNRWVVGVAAVAWIAYAIYEWRMSIWAASVIAPVRVDLFVLAPVLYGITVLGVWAVIAGRSPSPPA